MRYVSLAVIIVLGLLAGRCLYDAWNAGKLDPRGRTRAKLPPGSEQAPHRPYREPYIP